MRLSLRLSTLALLTASALVFAGLYVAERSLSRSERDNMRADAQESAARVSFYLSVRAEALSALKAFYVDDRIPPDTARFSRLVDALYGRRTELSSIGLTDSAGVVVRQRHYGGGDARSIIGLDVDTMSHMAIGATAATARRSGHPAVSMPGPLIRGDSGIVILQPLEVDGVFRGFAAGTVTMEQVRALFARRTTPQRRLGVAILADSLGRDTVLGFPATGPPGRRLVVVRAPVELPGGERWWLAIRYAGRSAVRLQLWGVALAAFGALVLGAWHEQRQTRRIADRSEELEHLSHELLRANRAKSEFLANVSHELRTPLNAIVGFTELLRDGVYGELTSRQSGPVGRIEASAAHLRELVDQVLDLARIAAGRLEVNTELVDLRQFVLDVATEVEPLLREKELTFSLAIGAGTPRLRTDPSHLRQILLNLLANAVNFTDTGSVTVRTQVVVPGAGAHGAARAARAPGGTGASDDVAASIAAEGMVAEGMTAEGMTAGMSAFLAGVPAALARRSRGRVSDPAASWVTIQVSDTGLGIAPRDQERIFDEFEQLNAGARGGAERRGTGLGLPISRRLSQLLGGDLTVDSEAGQGSTFTIWLPAR
ncbi:MAG: sensor histidine kinase [Gemmatimonadaceae bacterium]